MVCRQNHCRATDGRGRLAARPGTARTAHRCRRLPSRCSGTSPISPSTGAMASSGRALSPRLRKLTAVSSGGWSRRPTPRRRFGPILPTARKPTRNGWRPGCCPVAFIAANQRASRCPRRRRGPTARNRPCVRASSMSLPIRLSEDRGPGRGHASRVKALWLVRPHHRPGKGRGETDAGQPRLQLRPPGLPRTACVGGMSLSERQK